MTSLGQIDSGVYEYSRAFDSTDAASRYDDHEYSTSSHSTLLWNREQLLLRGIFEPLIPSQPRVLDFACGTGRITCFLDGLGLDVTGCDISNSMVERAQARCPRTQFLVGDILDPKFPLAATGFDAIVAFRFFLNADPPLRLAISRALMSLLAPGGILVANNHAATPSIKSLPRQLRRAHGRTIWRTSGNYLSKTDFRRLFEQAGFSREVEFGYGLLPGTLLTTRSKAAFRRCERLLEGHAIEGALGANQLIVCRKDVAQSTSSQSPSG